MVEHIRVSNLITLFRWVQFCYDVTILHKDLTCDPHVQEGHGVPSTIPLKHLFYQLHSFASSSNETARRQYGYPSLEIEVHLTDLARRTHGSPRGYSLTIACRQLILIEAAA